MNKTIEELDKRFKEGYYKNISPFNMIMFIIKKEDKIILDSHNIEINCEIDDCNTIYKSLHEDSIKFLQEHPEYELADSKLEEKISKILSLRILSSNGFEFTDEEINDILYSQNN